MNIVYLRDVKIPAKIGLHPWEYVLQQQLFADIELGLVDGRAAQSDEVADTVDYSWVAEVVRGLALARHYRLLEHLAEVMMRELLAHTRVQWVELCLKKPGVVPETAEVGVKLRRERGL